MKQEIRMLLMYLGLFLVYTCCMSEEKYVF